MFGLLGKKLSHSFSKQIHEELQNIAYNLYEVEDLDSFFSETNFQALNVTIPYKEAVFPYLDDVSDIAKVTRSVNTIIKENGRLIGYNTDYYGLDYMLKYNHIDVKNKHILIMGNGATSRLTKYYCMKNSASKITIAARNPRNKEIHFHQISTLNNVSIIFNATPVGMFPNNLDSFELNLHTHSNLEAVVDFIYNPLRSNLLLEAEKNGIKAVNGLLMLIHQAVKASEMFFNTTYSDNITDKLYHRLQSELFNLVIIGMPMSGKSFYGRLLAEKYHKSLIDIDTMIELHNDMSIPNIFSKMGEKAFRTMENKEIINASKQHNKAISCGGGVVVNPINMQHLKHNGIIIFLDVPLSILKEANPKDRPLLQDTTKLESLYYDRIELYKDYADILIEKTSYNENKIIGEIEVKLDEYFSS